MATRGHPTLALISRHVSESAATVNRHQITRSARAPVYLEVVTRPRITAATCVIPKFPPVIRVHGL